MTVTDSKFVPSLLPRQDIKLSGQQKVIAYRSHLVSEVGRREGRSKKVLRGQDGNSLGRTKVCWDLEEGKERRRAVGKKRSRGRLELADGQKAGFYKKIKRVVK